MKRAMPACLSISVLIYNNVRLIALPVRMVTSTVATEVLLRLISPPLVSLSSLPWPCPLSQGLSPPTAAPLEPVGRTPAVNLMPHMGLRILSGAPPPSVGWPLPLPPVGCHQTRNCPRVPLTYQADSTAHLQVEKAPRPPARLQLQHLLLVYQMSIPLYRRHAAPPAHHARMVDL